jgi:predicted nucleotidyltransferase
VTEPAAPDPAREYAQALSRTLPDAVESVFLFGSRSIGDYREDSDYDVAVFLRRRDLVKTHWRAVVDASYPFVERGFDLRPLVLWTERWSEESDLMAHIRRHGLRLA